MKKNNYQYLWAKISFFILGIISTIWFLVRVIPKPSRANYPCIRAAAPFMSSFILYLLSIAGSAVAFKKARRSLYKRRHILALHTLLLAFMIPLVLSGVLGKRSFAGTKLADPGDFPANIPYGKGLGNYPGRVVWSWNPDATDENCTNSKDDPVRGEDGYFMAKNNNWGVISAMVDEMLMELTGTRNVSSAWDSLFTDLNRRKGLGEVSYLEGQKIFIKINQGQAGWLTNSGPDDDLSFKDDSWAEKYYAIVETSPMVVMGILDQLINDCGVPAKDIYVGDPITHIYKHNYDQMFSAFPGVKYIDRDANHADIGRTILTPSQQPIMYYSDKGSVMPDAISDSYYSEMEEADYLVNIAALKAHSLAGVTLTAKNHFGSITGDGASHLHDGLICQVDDTPTRTEYGMYRVQTDIMGHEKLGGNTVLFVVDALWGTIEAKNAPVKWNMTPFNGDWTNSIFAAQDQVALESVCFDFLRTEFDDPAGPAKARPWMGGVDDYLQQAADAQFWPAGISYDPENDGVAISSLGIHEHWNNEIDKAYSRNLGLDSGIELLYLEWAGSNLNQAPEAAGSIPDFEILQSGTEYTIYEDVSDLFSDPDGDLLEYTIQCGENSLSFRITDNELLVEAIEGYEGEAWVSLIASDGEYEEEIDFMVSAVNTQTPDGLVLGPGIVCYPNPFKDFLFLEFDTGNVEDKIADLTIYNLEGQLVHSDTLAVSAGAKTTVSLNFLEGYVGLYVIEMKFEGETMSRIVSKQ